MIRRRWGGADFLLYKANGQVMRTMQERMVASGPGEEPWSLLTGQETLAELRNLIVRFSQACPTEQRHFGCPFCILSGLSYASLTNLVRDLSQEVCLDLFKQASEFHSKDGVWFQLNPGKQAD